MDLHSAGSIFRPPRISRSIFYSMIWLILVLLHWNTCIEPTPGILCCKNALFEEGKNCSGVTQAVACRSGDQIIRSYPHMPRCQSVLHVLEFAIMYLGFKITSMLTPIRRIILDFLVYFNQLVAEIMHNPWGKKWTMEVKTKVMKTVTVIEKGKIKSTHSHIRHAAAHPPNAQFTAYPHANNCQYPHYVGLLIKPFQWFPVTTAQLSKAKK